jgi:hypothetical protein
MSMEIHVFFRGKLPGTSALSRTLKELGFELAFVPPHYSLEGKRGHRPMLFRDEETGVEFQVSDGRKHIADRVAKKQLAKIDPAFDRCASFRFGSAEDEIMCGLCCAAALAKLVKGIVFEDEDGALWSIDQAIAEAKKLSGGFAKKGNRRPGTQTSDIKRYLRPLLEKRDDLALVGRYIIIRPVRHIIRGALLDRTGNKYRFRIWRYVNALHEHHHLEFSNELGEFYVWQPHFEPLLIDCLAEDVFNEIGHITTLGDLAEFKKRNYRLLDVITNLVLSGERDRAAEFVRQVDQDSLYNEGQKRTLREQWKLLSQDIETVCAKFHARETAMAKEMKLDDIWEPTPFPVELPRIQRMRTAEPIFETKPWVGRPPTLLQDMPERPGNDIRFAKDVLVRAGNPLLLAPINFAEAKERHRALEDYVLAARLTEDILLVMRWMTHYDRNEPPQFEFLADLPIDRPSVFLRVEFWGPSFVTLAGISQDPRQKTRLDLSFFRVANRHVDPAWPYLESEIWRCSFDRRSERSVRDAREDGNEDEATYSDAPLTPQERKLLRYAMPRFGEYEKLIEQVLTLIRHAGSWVDTQKGADLAEYLKSLGDDWRAGRDSNP